MKRVSALLALLCLILIAPVPVHAQEGEEEPPEPAPEEEVQEGEQEKEESPYEDFEKLVEDAEHIPGFFDFYRKGDKLYMAVTPAQLDQGFLFDTRVAQGIGAGGLYGGTTLSFFEMRLMAIEKHDEKLYLVQRPHRFGAENDPRARAAVDITMGSSVVETADIAATRPDSASVVDVTGWFVSDLSGVGRRLRFVASRRPGQPGSANFDRGRSYLKEAKAFQDNVSVEAQLTFRPGQPVGLPSVPDGRYIPVSIHYTLARLPEEPMERRIGDERVGNFWTVHKDFSAEDSTFFRRYVNRWRLEPGEQVGDKWRPVEPITFYIDHTVPDEYRAWFKEGVEAWNGAFEAAGWVDAIRAEELPEDADADDIQYATLRWNTSDQTGYGAIGPSKVDPRTGEILDADILFEANMFMGFRRTWRTMVDPVTAAGAFEMALGVGDFEAPESMSPGVELPGFASALTSQGVVAAALLASRGEMEVGDPISDELLHQYTVWVVMHEVGHSLGLQHNFRSSASTPLDQLHDESFTRENGVFSSVMEYPAVNLNADGPTGQYYTTGPGSYDRWAISFSYTHRQEDADEIVRQVAERKHMFGNEAGGPGALDPTINVYDLGADPLGWGMDRTALIRGLMDELPSFVLADNVPYSDLTSAYNRLASEYARAVAPAVKYIGGQYLNRDHVGDGRMPFENVPVEEQERALRFLVERVFAADALTIDEEILQRFGADRWTHWGNSTSFSGRLDFPFHEEVLAFQSSVLNQLLSPWRLSRIRDGETKFGQDEMVTIPELMGALTDAIWSELESGDEITPVRRDLQRAYLDAMTRILVNPAPRMPADARSVARWQLNQLNDRIGGADAGGDAYTAAHLAESVARIDKAVNAGLEAEGS